MSVTLKGLQSLAQIRVDGVTQWQFVGSVQQRTLPAAFLGRQRQGQNCDLFKTIRLGKSPASTENRRRDADRLPIPPRQNSCQE